MNITLWHGQDGSELVVNDTVIEYSRKIHRYQSEGDYKTLVTEYNTYGEDAAQKVLDYFRTARS
jgi:hypothetical protein